MATKLRKLKITRVAVCPQGANPDADILLFKAADPAVDKQGVTVSDVYVDTAVGTAPCADPHCDDPDCPVHGALVRARRKKKRVTKGPIGEMGMHGEPDGDEAVPLDYATRGQQYDLWETLWEKWQCLCATYSDVCGDWDEDNVPHLPILVRSVQQFHDDIQGLLEACGVVAKVAPALAALTTCVKAGAPMAGHRLTRFREALLQLQQILAECTPESITRPGISAAEAAGLPGYMATPAFAKGESSMAVRKNAESDKAHCAHCDDPDCENPAHDRLKKQETEMAKEYEARIAELETALAKAQSDLAVRETTIAKMQQTPEEQEAEYLASLPEAVRKKHVADQEEMVALRKQLADAREEREQTVYIAKAADFRHFGMAPQQHWRLLKAIDQMPAEDRDELLRLMSAAQEQARTASLFVAAGTAGHNGASSGDGGDASAQLMTLTKAYMDDKGVDFLKASEAIAKSHRDLYQRATQERRRASRVSSD